MQGHAHNRMAKLASSLLTMIAFHGTSLKMIKKDKEKINANGFLSWKEISARRRWETILELALFCPLQRCFLPFLKAIGGLQPPKEAFG